MTEGTESRSREPRAISLDLELSTIGAAMRGAEILADYQIRQGYLDEESERDAPESVFSILALLGGRLEQVRRVIRGEEDPERIWGAHNATTLPDSLADVDGDIVLFPWNARGMPLVLARPSGWGLEPEEREARQALGQEGRKVKTPKGPKGRKAKAPKEQASESLHVQGAAPQEAPPSAPGLT
jgi:hypothetical protein